MKAHAYAADKLARITKARNNRGRKTAAGKAHSRVNATRHGLAGRTVLLPTEDPGEFETSLDPHAIGHDEPAGDFTAQNETIHAACTQGRTFRDNERSFSKPSASAT